MDKSFGHARLRVVQVHIYHACQDKTVLRVGEARDVRAGGAEAVVRGRFSRRGRALRGMVPIRARRTIRGGGPSRIRRLVLLDQIDCRRDRFHWRISLYVYPMQSVHYIVQKVASI